MIIMFSSPPPCAGNVDRGNVQLLKARNWQRSLEQGRALKDESFLDSGGVWWSHELNIE